MNKINIYIDGNNLYRSAKELGFEIDYKKLRGLLRQKYNPQFVYLFIGLVPERIKFYEYLQKSGFILVFKQTVSVGEKIKGNCDAELVLKTTSDFYTKAFDSCILITGDGDFAPLFTYLITKKKQIIIINKSLELTIIENEKIHCMK